MASSVGDPPEKNWVDHGKDLVAAGVSGVPVLGGPAAELIGMMKGGYERRLEDWFETLGEAVDELQERVDGLDPLAGNEAFLTAFKRAAEIALGEHLEEKLEMLKRALVRIGVERPEGQDEFVALRMLDLIGELGVPHFVVLRYLRDPGGWFAEREIDPPEYLSAPRRNTLDAAQLGIDAEVLELVLPDLERHRLASTSMLGGMVSGRAALDPLTTSLGNELLDFVAEFE